MQVVYSLFGGVLLLLLPIQTVLAHGFGERVDLPIPFTLYAFSAAATVAVSFILIGLLTGKRDPQDLPQYDLGSLAIGRALFFHPFSRWSLKLIALFLTILIIIAGYNGSQIPSYNMAPTFVWILFAVGMVYFSAFLGNVWPVIHPASTVHSLICSVLPSCKKEKEWSKKILFWPGVCTYFLFRWIENVHPSPSEPSTIATLVIAYLVVSLIGMLAIGKRNWLTYCDPFNVFFTFLSFFAITKTDEKKGKKSMMLRFPGVGLFHMQRIPVSGIVFEMLMLSTIAFDGMKETPTWKIVRSAMEGRMSLGVIDTLGMVAFLAFFLGTYFFFSWLISICMSKKFTALQIASAFAFSMLPIAVAYEVAHFISLFMLDGQRAIYLLSDPLGLGWDIFGSAGYEVRYTFLNYTVLWNFQVLIIVLGHVIGVYVAHMRALSLLKNRTIAIRSQYPMLILMVCYTMFSLWIIAQPIIGG
jgi:hypothetical protein